MPTPDKPYTCKLCNKGTFYLPENRASLDDTPVPTKPCPDCKKTQGLHRLQVVHLVVEGTEKEHSYYSEFTKKYFKFVCNSALKLIKDGSFPQSHTADPQHCTCIDCVAYAAKHTVEFVE